MVADAAAIAANVHAVRARIEAAAARGGHGQAVRVVAAAKYVDAATVRSLAAAGVTDIGENRLDSLDAKQAHLGDQVALTWHYIGRLQSRKVRDVLARARVIHTLCSDSAAARIAEAVAQGVPAPQLLVQVNTARDAAKDGILPEQVEAFLDALPAALVVDGFMTMPAEAVDPQQSRAAFAGLRELRDRLRARQGDRHRLAELSMGTTQDFEVAVEEGATLVRLGRVLYGARE